MASAAFTIDSTATTDGAVVTTQSATVNLALSSISGVDTIEWSVAGLHDPGGTTPTITPAGSPLGATATFTMPTGTGTSAHALGIKCRINGGVDKEGQDVAAYTSYGVVGVNNTASRINFVNNEELWRHSSYGTTIDLNALANTIAGTLTAPINPTDNGKVAVASDGDLVYGGNGSLDVLTANTSIVSPFIELGTTPFAGTGEIRFEKNSAIKFSNTADSLDLTAVEMEATDVINFGAGASGVETFVTTNLRAQTTINLALSGSPKLSVTVSAVEISVVAIQFAQAVSAPTITQVAKGSGAAEDLTLQAQGTNDGALAAGDMIVGSGVNAGAGSDGEFRLRRGAQDYLVSGAGYVGISPAGNTLPDTGTLRIEEGGTVFIKGSTNKIKALSGSGDSLYIGSIVSAEMSSMQFNVPTGRVFVFVAPTEMIRFTLADIQITAPLVSFVAGASSPTIKQTAAGSGVGDALTVQAQNTTDAALAAGDLILTSGANAGAGPDGETRIQRGGTDYVKTGSGFVSFNPNAGTEATAGTMRLASGGTIKVRGSSQNVSVAFASGNTLILGSSAAGENSGIIAQVASGSFFNFTAGGLAVWYATGTFVEQAAPIYRFADAALNPTLQQEIDNTATVTGDTFTINAQDCGGTTAVTAGALALRAGDATGASGTRNGGALTARGGHGADADGSVTIDTGDGTATSLEGEVYLKKGGVTYVTLAGASGEGSARRVVVAQDIEFDGEIRPIKQTTSGSPVPLDIRGQWVAYVTAFVAGGSVSITGGQADSGTSTTTGGSVDIIGGPTSAGTGQVGGDVSLRGGNASSGTDGSVVLRNSADSAIVVEVNGTGLGFYAATPIAQPTVSGARDTPEAALADLLTELDNLGLINDTTTAT